ncbi:hypothetical protein BC830DRAFT_793842 [Chytriomyces sp. MP71]|nr:hypothetical protein BC830DRAFT_793842 [Chytriomyces sp. MP71]
MNKTEVLIRQSSNESFLRGHLGLTNTVHIEGIIQIKTTRPILSVSVSVTGNIFTSNGDARKHSPYEAHTFLNLGPDEVFADLKDERAEIGLDFLHKTFNRHLGAFEVPFSFPVTFGAGLNKMHESISASNPEWGFGARIAYTINATVLDGVCMKNSQLYRTLNSFTLAPWLASILESFFTTTTRITEPLEVLKYSPAAIKAMVSADKNCHRWSSETDVLGAKEELGVGHNFDYCAALSSSLFGPGDKVKIEFRVRPKPFSRVKITSVRVWVEEVQGVGIAVDSVLLSNMKKTSKTKELAELMSDTTLDRKYLVKELLVWKGKETFEGEFWVADQQLTFEVPRLAAKIRNPASFFETKYYGVNPSGNFASRIHIEHKVRIRIFSVSSRGSTLPPFDLPAATVQVTSFNREEACALITSLPKMMNEYNEERGEKHRMAKQVSSISLDDTIVASVFDSENFSEEEEWQEANETL